MKNITCILFLLFLMSIIPWTSAATNQGKVQGYVIDSDNNPISDLHVFLLGTNKADASDARGCEPVRRRVDDGSPRRG